MSYLYELYIISLFDYVFPSSFKHYIHLVRSFMYDSDRTIVPYCQSKAKRVTCMPDFLPDSERSGGSVLVNLSSKSFISGNCCKTVAIIY